MADFADAKHRPHAIHTGEEPRNKITYGPESLSVSLDRWGPTENLFTSLYDSLQANWGETPSRVIHRDSCDGTCQSMREHNLGWCRLKGDERTYVLSAFEGKTLPQALEGITFDFCIDGVSRAFTHQNVRTRIGAGFMQHGGRDNDWRHRGWTMPETMRRMCVAYEEGYGQEGIRSEPGLKHCISNWQAVTTYMAEERSEIEATSSDLKGFGIREAIEDHIMNGRRLYAALVDAGIPWQDARRVLFMGMQTYIHDQYNFLALKGVLERRLEHVMDWEFNCVAQLMLREVKIKCPLPISQFLGSMSDKAKQAKFAGLESWPPDGKYPNPFERCKTCGHNEGNHIGDFCEVCQRDRDEAAVKTIHVGKITSKAYHKYVGVDSLPRQHRPEQMPFFVLHPDSMAGGPIVWIPTNGTYPHDLAPIR